MAIWIKNKKGETCLSPHSFEKTLLGLSRLVCWIEGTNDNFNFSTDNRGFGIAGGPIWTNHGVSFKKEDLIELVSKMNDGSELKIAYPDQYVNTNRNRRKNEKTIEESFAEDNDKIIISPNVFATSKYVKEQLLLGGGNIHPDYVAYCKTKLNL